MWSYDVIEDRTHDERKYRMLNMLDEFAHESLTIPVAPLVFATDAPFGPVRAIAVVRELAHPMGDSERIFSADARRLLNI